MGKIINKERLSTLLAASKIIILLGVIFLVGYLTNGQQNHKYTGIVCKDCNIILINLTNFHYQHISANGYFRPTTPNLDTFAKESLVFENAYTQGSWTLPTGMSIFTSLYPYQHGVMNRRDGTKLDNEAVTLIDVMSQNGYKTAGFTGGFDYDPSYGLTDRFSEYEQCVSVDTDVKPFGYGDLVCTIPKALNWLNKNTSTNKFFLFVQGFDLHCPFGTNTLGIYDPDYKGSINYQECLWSIDEFKPEVKNGETYYHILSASESGVSRKVIIDSKDAAHMVALYDEKITKTDMLVGNFLNQLKKMGLYDNSIIIITSEHGDLFGKHGWFMRGGPSRGSFYNDALHVPLIIHHPRLKPAHYQQLVSLMDIAPTLLDFLSMKQQKNWEGKSLASVVAENKEIHDYIYAGSEFHPSRFNPYFNAKTRLEVIISKKWKLIQETIFSQDPPIKTQELYDLESDPEEMQNIVEKNKKILNDLQSRLSNWSKQMRKSFFE